MLRETVLQFLNMSCIGSAVLHLESRVLVPIGLIFAPMTSAETLR